MCSSPYEKRVASRLVGPSIIKKDLGCRPAALVLYIQLRDRSATTITPSTHGLTWPSRSPSCHEFGRVGGLVTSSPVFHQSWFNRNAICTYPSFGCP